MPTPKRITPRLTLTTTQGNAVQIGGLLGAAIRAWYAGREGPHGTRLPRPSAIGGPAIPPARPQPF